MSKFIFSLQVFRRTLPLVMALALLLGMSAVAYAQTSAEGGQYADTVSRGEGAIVSSGVGSASTDAGGAASAGAAGAAGSSAGGAVSVLPDTGGEIMPLVALGVLGIGATALIAVRRLGRQG